MPHTWDVAKPAGADKIKIGDDQIRSDKTTFDTAAKQITTWPASPLKMLSGTARILSGTFAAMPVAGNKDALYYASDTKNLYWDSGTLGTLIDPTLLTTYLKLAGGTMVGPIVLSGDPTLALHAATKQYVDAASGQTRIRLIPSDSDPGSEFADNGGSIQIGSGATGYMTALIPVGHKATGLRVYGLRTGWPVPGTLYLTLTVYECQISDATAVSKGTGTSAAEIDITDVAATTANYISVKMLNADATYTVPCWGGYITVERI